MRTAGWLLGIAFIGSMAAAKSANAQTPAVVQLEFTHPALTPAHWVLRLEADGHGHFQAERGPAASGNARTLTVGDVDRDVQLTPAFAASVMATARRHKLFLEACESGRKLAFTGTKKLSYSGPEGTGSCTYLYSNDKEIQALGDNLQAVAETLLAGAQLEKLVQYDRLGLDAEMEILETAAKDGRARQLGAIRATLTRLANDEALMERVRRRARALLARAEADPAQ